MAAGEPAPRRTRMAWQQIVDNIAFAAATVYQMGNLFFVYWLFRKKITVPLSRLLLYFAAQLWGMLLCTVPFGMIDSTSSVATYIFPLWNIGSWCVIFFVFMAGVQVYWKIRGQGKIAACIIIKKRPAKLLAGLKFYSVGRSEAQWAHFTAARGISLQQ